MRQRYSKHYSSPRQIIDILKNERGLLFENESKAERCLINIGYHRLSAYIHPFYQTPKSEKKVKRGTSFIDVMGLYRFDRKLRVLLFNEIEKVEVAIRSVLANIGCAELGDDYWITNPCHFVELRKFNRTKRAIKKELAASGDDFIESFCRIYSDPYPPAWITSEVLSFGNLNYIYSNLASSRLKKDIADYFGMNPMVFTSWLSALVNTRNICCHHARMWNREFVTIPANVRHPHNRWIDTSRINRARTYYRICIVKYFLDTISPQNNMRDKLVGLFARFPQIDLVAMGFPSDWQTEPLWQDAKTVKR